MDIQFVMLIVIALNEFILFGHSRPHFTLSGQRKYSKLFTNTIVIQSRLKSLTPLFNTLQVAIHFPTNLYVFKCLIHLGECMPQFHSSSLTIV